MIKSPDLLRCPFCRFSYAAKLINDCVFYASLVTELFIPFCGELHF